MRSPLVPQGFAVPPSLVAAEFRLRMLTINLGCVYIYPTAPAAAAKGYDAQVILWARHELASSGLEDRLYEAVKRWLLDDWPFQQAGFPGIDISWADWCE